MISSELLLFFCAFVASASAAIDLNSEECGVSAIADRIINGQPAEPHMWPWQVIVISHLDKGGMALCGGSLINDQWILTAAHCIYEVDNIHVILGQSERPKSPNAIKNLTIQIELAIPNPQFNRQELYNDIALLKMPNSISFTDEISPICLPTKNVNLAIPGTTAVAIGWGSISEDPNDPQIPNVLMQVELPINNIDDCEAADVTLNSEEQICAGHKSNNTKAIKDTCNGDSGGPLMMLDKDFWYLIGVTSYGADGDCDGAGVYTNVAAYMDWITVTIQENSDDYDYDDDHYDYDDDQDDHDSDDHDHLDYYYNKY